VYGYIGTYNYINNDMSAASAATESKVDAADSIITYVEVTAGSVLCGV